MAERLQIAEDSKDESGGENVYEGLNQGSANSEQVRPTWKVIFLNGSDSETVINDLKQTDSILCQLVSFGSDSNDTNIATQAQSDGFTPKPRKLDWLLGTEQNWYTSNFLQNQGVGCKLRTC